MIDEFAVTFAFATGTGVAPFATNVPLTEVGAVRPRLVMVTVAAAVYLTRKRPVVAGGTTPTVTVVETTPGVDATHRGAAPGTLIKRDDTNVLYINTGTAIAPTWTVVGAQT